MAAKRKAKRKKAKKRTAKKRTTRKKAKRRTAKRKTAKRRTAKRKTAKRKTKRKVVKRKKKKATKRKKAAKRKPAKRKAKKKKKKKTKRKPNPAFMRPVTPDGHLSAVVGAKPIPRTELTKKLWAYIRRNGLQDNKNRRMINADAKLKRVFNGKSQVSMFEMTKLVSRHVR